MMPQKRRLTQPHVICLGLLILIEAVVLFLWVTDRADPSARWIGRLAVLNLVVAGWLFYIWRVTRLWYWQWLTGLTAVLGLAGGLWGMGYRSPAVTVFGTVLMSGALAGGLWAIRLALSPGRAVFGVARAVVDEAVRMKLALIFIIVLVVLLPVLPTALDPAEQLRYRVQFFLMWSLSGVSVVLSLMTLFLACSTICGEVHDRQIYLTMTKPVSRGGYLFGKWLGIMLLNLLLICVSGAGVYVYAKYLGRQPGQGVMDRAAVNKQVLVARTSITPQPPPGMDLKRALELRIEQLQKEDPYKYPDEIDPAVRRQVWQSVLAKWHSIAPREDRSYLFAGLGEAAQHGQWLQLRFKPRMARPPEDELVRLALWLNQRPIGQVVVADNQYHVIDLPVSAVDGRGNLLVSIANVDLAQPGATFPASVMFAPNEGLQVLYQVGRFEPNLARGLGIVWVRLGFIAALGLGAGTFLGFPVACLLSLLVYCAASVSGFLIEALHYYASVPVQEPSLWQWLLAYPRQFFGQLTSGELWGAFKVMIRAIGQVFIALVPALSEYNPVPLIADGRVVEGRLLVSALGKVGLGWTSGLGLLGWLIFRRRELARVTV